MCIKVSSLRVDMLVICDSSNASRRRSVTSRMSEQVVALQDSNNYNLFEASNVYKVGGDSMFFLVVECIGRNRRRYFPSSWTPLAVSQTNPFAGTANVAFSGDPWTMDISHSDACGTRYLYQGMSQSSPHPS